MSSLNYSGRGERDNYKKVNNNNNNNNNKEAENILKYKDLITEIQRMRNVKANMIPVIIGESGSIS